MDSNNCTGHLGHIELPAPIYNPFLLKNLLRLLNSKCFNCHKLKLRKKEKQYFFLKFILIKLGFIMEATELQGIVFNSSIDSSKVIDGRIENFIKNFLGSNSIIGADDMEIDEEDALSEEEKAQTTNSNKKKKDRNGSIDTLNTDENTDTATSKKANNKGKKKGEISDENQDLIRMYNKLQDEMKLQICNVKSHRLQEILEKLEKFSFENVKNIYSVNNNAKLRENNSDVALCDQNVNIQIKLKETLVEFWKSFKPIKCPHCDSSSIRLKKQGFLKIFQLPLSKKEKKKMIEKGLNPERDALEEYEDVKMDLENEEEVKTNKKGKGKKKKDNINKKGKNKTKSAFNDDLDSDSSDEISEDEIKEDFKISKTNKNANSNIIQNAESTFKFLHAIEVREHIYRLWSFDGDLLSILFGNLFKIEIEDENKKYKFQIKSQGPNMFFLDVIVVPPNRFRPENRSGSDGGVYLHTQSALLTKVINLSNQIRQLLMKQSSESNKAEDEKDSNENSSKKKKQKKNEIAESLEKANSEEESKIKDSKALERQPTFKDIVSRWIDLQDTVNIFYDSSKNQNKKQEKESNGIRQILEKKEGMFRMKMMGKRVNYAGRSVISPDPMIGANEVGIPLYIASKLTFPEPVTKFNIEQLKKLVINGAFKYPGANLVENENGSKIALDQTKESYRIQLANTLDQGKKIVYRHLHTGDILLVNRQPTLHKPSIMSHKARVLPGEKTIRLHYSNCNSYNADFDGDEMNVHLLQNHIARQEAYTISNTDNQYIVPTSGKPIRGLIQDSIVSAVFLTMKNTFFTKDEYYQIVYSALDIPLNSGAIRKIVLQQPAILKPKPIWTGKQVVTTILRSLTTSNKIDYIQKETEKGINFEHGTKLFSDVWGPDSIHEGMVVVRNNELLTGVLDKNHIGNSEYGLVHSFYEIYGGTMAGELISTLGRLFINYLQFFNGFTCGVDDILLKDEYNLRRRKDIENILQNGMEGLSRFFGLNSFKLNMANFSNRNVLINDKKKIEEVLMFMKLLPEERTQIERLLELQNYDISKFLNYPEDEPELMENIEKIKELREKYYENILKDDTIDANIDVVVKNSINKPCSQSSNNWLKYGLVKNFPSNFFSMMVLSGAKGSLVNHSQITCMLGQQELEGKRVPRMASGRTLPSFEPFDPNPRAGGFISDRFSTGIRPQEFFFHCMAGREGLIDTAVKTSRSGYLQRCLIKHLEQLVVNYDYTVRDQDGNVIQFMYGEDSIDVINTKYLKNFKFISKNVDIYYAKYKPERLMGKIDTKTVRRERKNISEVDTLLSKYDPWRFLGSISDKVFEDMNNFIKSDPEKIFKKDEEEKIEENNNKESESKGGNNKLSRSKFKTAVYLKYLNSLISPGESVGILAAQSVGEPSTQMTLNTFHLAGHGGVNMTLGIPRLREILMTSENNIKTPIMTIPCYSKDVDSVKKLARRFEKYSLIDIVKEIDIKRSIAINENDNRKKRIYQINISFEEFKLIEEYFKMDESEIKRIFKINFIPNLAKTINKYLKLSNKKGEVISNRQKEKIEEEVEEENYEINKRKNSLSENESGDEEDTTKKEDTEDDFYMEINKSNMETEDEPTGTNTMTLRDETNEDTNQDREDENVSENAESDEEGNVENLNLGKNKKKEKKTKPAKESPIDIIDKKEFRFEEVFVYNMDIELSEDNSYFKFDIAVPFTLKTILLKK